MDEGQEHRKQKLERQGKVSFKIIMAKWEKVVSALVLCLSVSLSRSLLDVYELCSPARVCLPLTQKCSAHSCLYHPLCS